jgi:Domain of unknown function (DUF6249)
MTTRALRHVCVLTVTLLAAPLAVAQEMEGHGVEAPMHWLAMAMFPVLGMLFVLGILAIISYGEYRQQKARLASIERLVTAGHPVPRELVAPALARMTLPEQYRRDVRRGITLLVWAIGVALVFYFTSGGQLRT